MLKMLGMQTMLMVNNQMKKLQDLELNQLNIIFHKELINDNLQRFKRNKDPEYNF